jgi:hypothetical protein
MPRLRTIIGSVLGAALLAGVGLAIAGTAASAASPPSSHGAMIARDHAAGHPVPPCWRATYQPTSGGRLIPIVFCLPGKRPAGSNKINIINDGSDGGRIDRGDVLVSGWYPPVG